MMMSLSFIHVLEDAIICLFGEQKGNYMHLLCKIFSNLELNLTDT